MNDTIRIITNYINDCLFEPKANWSINWFKERSYSRWAANEILGLIIIDPLTQPTDIIYQFIINMNYYVCSLENANIRFIFSTANFLFGLIISTSN